MEIVCDGILFQLPIYRDASHMNGDYITFADFYIPEPENGWPIDFTFRWIHDKLTPSGRFVAISPLLVEIFKQLRPGITMEEFLRDFRAKITVPRNSGPHWHELKPGEVNLTHNLAKLGFVASSADCFGVTLHVDISWAFRDEISDWQYITAGFIEFRPRCGKLNDGKWVSQRWEECIENHYFKRFAAVAPTKPIQCLRATEDIDNLLKHFEWSNTTRHNDAELRIMRIEVAQNAPELWSKPKQLAELLRSRDLYSPNTSTSQIVKFLPGLLQHIENSVGRKV